MVGRFGSPKIDYRKKKGYQLILTSTGGPRVGSTGPYPLEDGATYSRGAWFDAVLQLGMDTLVGLLSAGSQKKSENDVLLKKVRNAVKLRRSQRSFRRLTTNHPFRRIEAKGEEGMATTISNRSAATSAKREVEARSGRLVGWWVACLLDWLVERLLRLVAWIGWLAG